MEKITQKLLKIGVRPNYTGFKYLEVAIKYYLDHIKELVKIMKIYEHTAKEFNTSRSIVERAIRHAKENCSDKQYKYMTAGRFMATIATELQYEKV